MAVADERVVDRVILLQPAGLEVLIIRIGIEHHLRAAIRRVETQTERHRCGRGGRLLPVVYHARGPALRHERREQRPAPMIVYPPHSGALPVFRRENILRAAVGALYVRCARSAAQRCAARATFQLTHFHMICPPFCFKNFYVQTALRLYFCFMLLLNSITYSSALRHRNLCICQRCVKLARFLTFCSDLYNKKIMNIHLKCQGYD